MRVERTISIRNADGVWSEVKTDSTVPLGSYLKVRVVVTPLGGDGDQLHSPRKPQAMRRRNDPGR